MLRVCSQFYQTKKSEKCTHRRKNSEIYCCLQSDSGVKIEKETVLRLGDKCKIITNGRWKRNHSFEVKKRWADIK